MHTNWFSLFVSIANPDSLLLGNTTIFYVVLAILGVVLLDAFVVGYFFSQNQFKFVWTLRYLRIICTLFVTVLYMPVIGLFISMLTNCGDHVNTEATCWQGTLALRSAVVVVVGLLYTLLTVAFALSVFQQDPTDRSEILSRPHSRIEVYNLLMKTIITIIFVLLGEKEGYVAFIIFLLHLFHLVGFNGY